MRLCQTPGFGKNQWSAVGWQKKPSTLKVAPNTTTKKNYGFN